MLSTVQSRWSARFTPGLKPQRSKVADPPVRTFAASELQSAPKPDERELNSYELENAEVVYDEQTKFVSEFIVTALFNFLSCTAVSTAQQMSAGNAVHATFMVMGAHAVILPMLIFAFMPISGAHFNPMVTFAMVAAGRQTPTSGLSYLVAQCTGAIVGAFTAFSVLPSSLQNIAHAGVQAVPEGRTVLQAFTGEAFASAFFLFILFGTLVDPRGWKRAGPWAVPLAILLLMWLVGPISSMCINPARALGPAVVSGFWDNHWIWWTAPFIGGASASVTYQKLFLPKVANKLNKQK